MMVRAYGVACLFKEWLQHKVNQLCPCSVGLAFLHAHCLRLWVVVGLGGHDVIQTRSQKTPVLAFGSCPKEDRLLKNAFYYE